MGEYARCLTIATALARRAPGLEMHFALSRAAPYATDTPFPTTLLPSSATFHPHEVRALIRELEPRVVVFDNAGRTIQLRAAHAATRATSAALSPADQVEVQQRDLASYDRAFRVLDGGGALEELALIAVAGDRAQRAVEWHERKSEAEGAERDRAELPGHAAVLALAVGHFAARTSIMAMKPK